MREFKSIKITDEKGIDYTDVVLQVFIGIDEVTDENADGEWPDLVTGTERSIFTTSQSIEPILEKWSEGPAFLRQYQWESGPDAWIIAECAVGGNFASLGLCTLQPDESGRLEFGAVLDHLDLKFEVEWEAQPMLYAHAHTPGDGEPRAVTFYEHGGHIAGEETFTVAAGRAESDDALLLIVDTTESIGHIRILLNDAVIYNGDPEVSGPHQFDLSSGDTILRKVPNA